MDQYSRGEEDDLSREVPDECAGLRLDAAAARVFGEYSRVRLSAWIARGLLLHNGAPARRGRDPVAAGDELTLAAEVLEESRVDAQPEDMPLNVVYADEVLAVIDKPAGLTVHPGAGQPNGTLLNGLLHRFPQVASLPRAGIVHRLDKDTSGLLVVALEAGAQARLTDMLAAREVHREYLALVHGRVIAGAAVDTPIGRDPRQRTRMAVMTNGRPAVTHYRVEARYPIHTLLRVQLETGRTHQIRVHLSHIRHGIVGDSVYARGGHALPIHRQALHATRLAFAHPDDGRPMVFDSPLPEDFARVLAGLQEET
jgi:ribosomal large subunit pseudouridine synthase D (EC 5.4.99.-)